MIALTVTSLRPSVGASKRGPSQRGVLAVVGVVRREVLDQEARAAIGRRRLQQRHVVTDDRPALDPLPFVGVPELERYEAVELAVQRDAKAGTTRTDHMSWVVPATRRLTPGTSPSGGRARSCSQTVGRYGEACINRPVGSPQPVYPTPQDHPSRVAEGPSPVTPRQPAQHQRVPTLGSMEVTLDDQEAQAVDAAGAEYPPVHAQHRSATAKFCARTRRTQESGPSRTSQAGASHVGWPRLTVRLSLRAA
ncbi:hypothetical protein DSM112329_04731 [Paraconexibacter sp. AEG42_29]|uniref:Uncharacterized protein n=1 Tax=Paraconexibacter sp. AEG42_29 TaxID=2997339 RepID=A0AAU7B1G3_9ACTN